MEKEKDIIIHVHIFKNAGTTFDHTLQRNFLNGFVDNRDDEIIKKEKIKYLINFLQQNPNIKAFSNHSIHFPLTNRSNFNFIPIYFLRHPIERIKSVYNFEKNQVGTSTLGSQLAKELGYNDFIKWYMLEGSPATIRNSQTIFLSGRGPGPHNMNHKFKLAMKTLLEEKNLIGIVNRYNESMVVFEEKLKKFFPTIDLSYIIKNVTNKNFEKSLEEKIEDVLTNLDESVKKEVIEKNSFDLKLFEAANKRLDEEIKSIENFEEKLYDFNKRCEELRQKMEKED